MEVKLFRLNLGSSKPHTKRQKCLDGGGSDITKHFNPALFWAPKFNGAQVASQGFWSTTSIGDECSGY